jgi:hypothetical protein
VRAPSGKQAALLGPVRPELPFPGGQDSPYEIQTKLCNIIDDKDKLSKTENSKFSVLTQENIFQGRGKVFAFILNVAFPLCVEKML